MRPNRLEIVNPGQTGRTHAVADPLESSMTTTGRIQLALNVTDLAAAVRVYSDVFGTEPSKQRPGYANFAIADPPLKLVLFENPDATSALNHLGVELTSSAEVAESPLANSVTSWPCRTSSSVRYEMTRSVPP